MSDTQQMTITEFLEARITEDEALAQRAKRVRRYGIVVEGGGFGAARVLAECAAKRVFMAEWQRVVVEHRRAYGVDPSSPVIAAFAAVYKDHPDYRQEWAK